MSLIAEIAGELAGMFVGDARLSLAILAVVGVAAALRELSGLDPLLGGAVLLVGSLAVLIESVRRSARGNRLP
ncbi:MAG TPA: hypothetical protein VND95_11600 [Stellaceae bacterium]|nr:hypothetical protein [Stellaceae bacterium]